MHVPNPHWLAESFSDELNSVDIGSVDRCLVVADFLEVLVRALCVQDGKFVDWGGGYGLLTRIMRDRGFDFQNFDPYVKNLFASNAQVSVLPSSNLVVASEVFLHIPDPVRQIEELLRLTDFLLLTAVIPPKKVDQSWWYFMPITGQHISIYTVASLESIANQLGVRLVSDGRFFHLFYKKKLSIRARAVMHYRFVAFSFSILFTLKRYMLRSLGRSRSLTPIDQDNLIASQSNPTGKQFNE